MRTCKTILTCISKPSCNIIDEYPIIRFEKYDAFCTFMYCVKDEYNLGIEFLKVQVIFP